MPRPSRRRIDSVKLPPADALRKAGRRFRQYQLHMARALAAVEAHRRDLDGEIATAAGIRGGTKLAEAIGDREDLVREVAALEAAGVRTVGDLVRLASPQGLALPPGRARVGHGTIANVALALVQRCI